MDYQLILSLLFVFSVNLVAFVQAVRTIVLRQHWRFWWWQFGVYCLYILALVIILAHSAAYIGGGSSWTFSLSFLAS